MTGSEGHGDPISVSAERLVHLGTRVLDAGVSERCGDALQLLLVGASKSDVVDTQPMD